MVRYLKQGLGNAYAKLHLKLTTSFEVKENIVKKSERTAKQFNSEGAIKPPITLKVYAAPSCSLYCLFSIKKYLL